MTRAFWATLGVATVLAGCGGSGPQGVLAAPHGGLLVNLPDDKGYVEVLKTEAPGQPGPGRVAVYFLDPSRKAMNSPPKDVSIKLRSSKNLKPVELKPGDGGSMESPPLTQVAEIEGDLMFALDGKPITVAITVR